MSKKDFVLIAAIIAQLTHAAKVEAALACAARFAEVNTAFNPYTFYVACGLTREEIVTAMVGK